jgi:hypothetical protein
VRTALRSDFPTTAKHAGHQQKAKDMKATRYTKFLIASAVSLSMAAGPVLAQEAAPAPVAPAAQAPAPAAPAAPAVAAPATPAPLAAAPTSPTAAADPWQQEFAVWQAAAAGNTVEEYQGYLAAYPNGKFASIAQARVVKLATAEEKADAEDSDRADIANAPPQAPATNFTVGTPMEESVILGDLTTRREVQGRLTSLGFATGGTDGVMGPRSRTAISQWQTVVSAPVSGYLSYDQLAKLRADSATIYPGWLASRPRALPPIRRSNSDQLVGRVHDDSADAAIALGVLGLAAGVIGGAAIAGGRHHHGGPRYYGHRRH